MDSRACISEQGGSRYGSAMVAGVIYIMKVGKIQLSFRRPSCREKSFQNKTRQPGGGMEGVGNGKRNSIARRDTRKNAPQRTMICGNTDGLLTLPIPLFW